MPVLERRTGGVAGCSVMMWRDCELEERGGGEIIYANWILRQGTVGAVQCFWRVSEVVSEQSVEDYDCRRFLVSRTSWRSGLGSGYPDHPGVPGRSYSDCHVDSQNLRYWHTWPEEYYELIQRSFDWYCERRAQRGMSLSNKHNSL